MQCLQTYPGWIFSCHTFGRISQSARTDRQQVPALFYSIWEFPHEYILDCQVDIIPEKLQEHEELVKF